MRQFRPANGERPDDFTPERCREFVRQAVGIPDLPVEVINLAFWTLTAQVAERFQNGRVFLAGDAAHRLPPTGGFGANTGIQDAHNLAWKLAAVLHGWAGPRLLETYREERRPVAQANTDFSVTNLRRWAAAMQAMLSGDEGAVAAALKEQVKHLDSQGQGLGFWYASGAVVPDETPTPPADSQEYLPVARPGSRAPHVWLRPAAGLERRATAERPHGASGSAFTSTLDFFERGFNAANGTGGEPPVRRGPVGGQGTPDSVRGHRDRSRCRFRGDRGQLGEALRARRWRRGAGATGWSRRMAKPRCRGCTGCDHANSPASSDVPL